MLKQKGWETNGPRALYKGPTNLKQLVARFWMDREKKKTRNVVF